MAENASNKSNTYAMLQQLNAADADRRLAALTELRNLQQKGQLELPRRGQDVNNHIHTFYSFSPYSPAKAVWQAWQAGLATAGIMDHDTIAGAREFIEAGRIIGLPTTIGAECRASFAKTALAGRRINNPDQSGVAYVALHGVPHSQIDALTEFFQPVRQARLKRNQAMTSRLNKLIAPAGLHLDFDQDIIPLSRWSEGGQITERHLLYAVAIKLIERFPESADMIGFMKKDLAMSFSARVEKVLLDPQNPYLDYDVLGVLKSDLVEKFYIDATDECPPIDQLSSFAREHGIILAYAYLGDVTESVTGDKKAQAFEDEYLDELFEMLHDKGFQAVTYMPSRNSTAQLVRVKQLCQKNDLFQISGEDINQPRQAFICEAMRDPFFANLFDAAWALIGHEQRSTKDLAEGLFSKKTAEKWPVLEDRMLEFSKQTQKNFLN